MDAETALAWVDQLLIRNTGERLSALQKDVLRKVLRGQRYLEIAAHSGYTEGHIKDVGSHLWKVLSRLLGERITKSTCRMVLERYFQTDVDGLAIALLPAPDPLLRREDALPLERMQPATRPHPLNPAQGLLPAAAPPKPDTLLGRAEAIAHLDRQIQQGSKIIVIQGEGGLGKTTLAQHYLQSRGFEVVLELLMAKETQNITSAERVVEEWLKQDLGQEPGTEFGVSLGRLKRQLHQRCVGILIDNLEPALDPEGRLIPLHRAYGELLRVLGDARVQSVTLITSRDRLCEPGLTVDHYRLPRLELAAWQQFFSDRLAVEVPTLQSMHWAYGGNAKAMGILCGIIQEDFNGDMAAYWRENQQDLLATWDLRNLVVSQVNRLQNLDPDAYRLLCRLGCYRFQDIPTLPSEGLLCLLWDVPPAQRRPILASLRNRSLVECEQGRYWLHPAIQVEAIARLRNSNDWEMAHRNAAKFWTAQVTTIETLQDALQALEAYYHYIEIQDFETAGQVILKSRTNQWRQFLPLGSTLYRMGLLHPVLNAITQVIPKLPSTPQLSELYNILGDLYWITGRVQEAIACQQKTMALATTAQQNLDSGISEHTRYYLRMLEVDALLSMGLYQMDFWDLETAIQLFQQVIHLAQQTAHHPWAEKASVCLALVKSYCGLSEDAWVLAEVVYQTIQTQQFGEQVGRFAYFIQMLGQTYVNLGALERGQMLYQRALDYAEESHYTQVKAKTMTGLAEVARQQQLWEQALEYHRGAIALLDTIGATCDLANAYLQLGLTYQQIGNGQTAQENFDRAQFLFQQMQATRQVERVLLLRS